MTWQKFEISSIRDTARRLELTDIFNELFR